MNINQLHDIFSEWPAGRVIYVEKMISNIKNIYICGSGGWSDLSKKKLTGVRACS